MKRAKKIKLTPGQWYLLGWSGGFSSLNIDRYQSDAPFDATLGAANGLAKRGMLTRDDNGIFWLTDAGREARAAHVLCPACSLVCTAGEVLPAHDCPHGVACTPAVVDPETRRALEGGTRKHGHWSRTCEKCNSSTRFQIRSAMGPRQRAPDGYVDPDDE